MSPAPCVRGEGTQIETPLRQPLDTIAARSLGVNGISVTPSILTHLPVSVRSILTRSSRYALTRTVHTDPSSPVHPAPPSPTPTTPVHPHPFTPSDAEAGGSRHTRNVPQLARGGVTAADPERQHVLKGKRLSVREDTHGRDKIQ